jgi:hypothetical protein
LQLVYWSLFAGVLSLPPSQQSWCLIRMCVSPVQLLGTGTRPSPRVKACGGCCAGAGAGAGAGSVGGNISD